MDGVRVPATVVFQSTLPVKGATMPAIATQKSQDVSIHAPREGSDALRRQIDALGAKFQSTLPVKGATSSAHARPSRTRVSIHAPREGSDSPFCKSQRL